MTPPRDHRLRQRRLRLGLSQAQVAARARARQSAVSKAERGAASDGVTARVRTAIVEFELERRKNPDAFVAKPDPTPPPRDHRLEQRRTKLGLTLAAVARRAGLSEGLIHRAEQAHRRPHDRHAASLVRSIRTVLVHEELARRRTRWFLAAEEERIQQQRSLWAALPDHPAVDALKQAMLARALELLLTGDGSECDALTEFLPAVDVEWAVYVPFDEAMFESTSAPTN